MLPVDAPVLVTGAAGFIGYHVADRLCGQGVSVVGLDSLNDYYDVSLKRRRLQQLEGKSFAFVPADLADDGVATEILAQWRPSAVIHLAAQAGVRYSLQNPQAYLASNITAFLNLLEAARGAQQAGHPLEHLVYASSSSVYGANNKVPYAVEDRTDSPRSLYAATKKADELMAYSYANLFGLPLTGLRFFTAYGPWGRPDMAYFSFADKMVAGRPIQLFNSGDMWRDFTYIDDIVEGVVRVLEHPPAADEAGLRYRLYNIGHHQPEHVGRFVELLEELLLKHGVIDRPAIKEFVEMRPEEVYQTYADISGLQRDFGFEPKTGLAEGLEKFVVWYKAYRDGSL
jgi:UDP-glucuronate 4-epimerase